MTGMGGGAPHHGHRRHPGAGGGGPLDCVGRGEGPTVPSLPPPPVLLLRLLRPAATAAAAWQRPSGTAGGQVGDKSSGGVGGAGGSARAAPDQTDRMPCVELHGTRQGAQAEEKNGRCFQKGELRGGLGTGGGRAEATWRRGRCVACRRRLRWWRHLRA